MAKQQDSGNIQECSVHWVLNGILALVNKKAIFSSPLENFWQPQDVDVPLRNVFPSTERIVPHSHLQIQCLCPLPLYSLSIFSTNHLPNF